MRRLAEVSCDDGGCAIPLQKTVDEVTNREESDRRNEWTNGGATLKSLHEILLIEQYNPLLRGPSYGGLVLRRGRVAHTLAARDRDLHAGARAAMQIRHSASRVEPLHARGVDEMLKGPRRQRLRAGAVARPATVATRQMSREAPEGGRAA